MIPKRIYQIWINKDDNVPFQSSMPLKSQEFAIDAMDWCEENGYEHVLINNQSEIYKECIENSNFCKTQLKNKAWFFPCALSDYIRLWVLNKYGGIYIDCDVKIKDGFDDFLNNDFFISIEPLEHPHQELFRRFDVGIIGSTKNCDILNDIIYYLDNVFCEDYLCGADTSKFFNVDNLMHKTDIKLLWIALPDLWPFLIQEHHNKNLDIVHNKKPLIFNDDTFQVYDETFFSKNGKYTQHHFHSTWVK